MKRLKLASLFVAGFIAGGIAVSLVWNHLWSRLTVSKEVEVAANAAVAAEWLAEFRLGETQGAIHNLEESMDIQVATVANWAEVCPPDENQRKAIDRWLVSVKVYHQSYPARGEEAASVNSMLSTIPGREPNKKCQSGICRLDDRRIAALSSKTNSP